MAEIRIRQADERDYKSIKKLINDTGINPTGLDWHRFLVAESSDGEFAGCGQIKQHHGGVLELASIAVTPTNRRQGIASLIIRNLLEHSSRPLYLMCMASLEGFYSKFGFHTVSKNSQPRYFERITRLTGLLKTARLMQDELRVMVSDQQEEK